MKFAELWIEMFRDHPLCLILLIFILLLFVYLLIWTVIENFVKSKQMKKFYEAHKRQSDIVNIMVKSLNDIQNDDYRFKAIEDIIQSYFKTDIHKPIIDIEGKSENYGNATNNTENNTTGN